MPQLAVSGPLDEGDLHDDLRTHPVRPLAWQAGAFRKRRRGNLGGAQLRPKVFQHLRVQPRPDLASEDEVAVLKVSNQQRAEPDARTTRIGEAPDHELLRRLA